MDQRSKAKIMKLLKGNIGGSLYNLGLGSGFLDMAQKAQATKEKNT